MQLMYAARLGRRQGSTAPYRTDTTVPLAIGARTLPRVMRGANVDATVALNPAPGRATMSKERLKIVVDLGE